MTAALLPVFAQPAFARIGVGRVVKMTRDGLKSPLQKAAERGDAKAQYALGNAYSKGQDVSKSDEQAVSWYQKSASQGYAPAQAALGYAYSSGLGVTHDDQQAVSFFKKRPIRVMLRLNII